MKVNTTVKNKFKVPKKQWAKWNIKARALFNTLYYAMVNNAYLFQHNDAELVSKKHWNVTAWNAAWTAASELDWVEAYCESVE